MGAERSARGRTGPSERTRTSYRPLRAFSQVGDGSAIAHNSCLKAQVPCPCLLLLSFPASPTPRPARLLRDLLTLTGTAVPLAGRALVYLPPNGATMAWHGRLQGLSALAPPGSQETLGNTAWSAERGQCQPVAAGSSERQEHRQASSPTGVVHRSWVRDRKRRCQHLDKLTAVSQLQSTQPSPSCRL